MRTLRFDGPSHYLRPDGPDGPRIRRGEIFTCPDDRAEEHLTNPHYDCSEIEEASGRELTRDELDELARQAGIEEPERLPNKAAVRAAIAEKEPEAGSGEGPDNDQED